MFPPCYYFKLFCNKLGKSSGSQRSTFQVCTSQEVYTVAGIQLGKPRENLVIGEHILFLSGFAKYLFSHSLCFRQDLNNCWMEAELFRRSEYSLVAIGHLLQLLVLQKGVNPTLGSGEELVHRGEQSKHVLAIFNAR